MIIYIPFTIYELGCFFFLGDFNVQQIPFYSLAHEAVRNGEIFWNWNTDLGANFIGSYSFYLLFSPFFWLTLPFPNEAIPYLIAPLLILKTACAGLTSYLYISRFVKDRYYSLMGAVLYAFSGFLTYNIFFNHFHEVVVFFPLLLIAVEELVTNNKKGYLIAAVAINAMVNYWFFIGEVVFVIIYVIIRMTSKGWQMTPKKFFLIAFEAVIGLLMAAVVLLPSVLAIMGNPRAGTDDLIHGWNFWIYWADQRQGAILQSLFFPPDLPSQPNFFPDHNAKWSSMNGWLPLVSTIGVFSFFKSYPQNWIKKLLATSLIMALIPGFNALFVLFNHSYYARWYYMPILIACLATAIAFENSRTKTILKSTKLTGFIVLFFVLAIGLTPDNVEDSWAIGLMKYPIRFWVYSAVAVGCVLITYYLFKYLRHTEKFKEKLLLAIITVAVGFSWGFITLGKCYGDPGSYIRQVAIGMRDELITHSEEDPFVRTDIYQSMDNLGMYWQIPNIQAFHSIVPVSTMEFYPAVGIKRDVSSKPETKYYALRSLLSVKWHYVPMDKETEEHDWQIHGFELWDSQGEFNIYENKYYLPMGFGYTQIASKEAIGSVTIDKMYDTLLLEDGEAVRRNRQYATINESLTGFSSNTVNFGENYQEHLALSCYEFTIDKYGFTAKSNLSEQVMMFFSVPYDSGWTATVNGKEAVVEKANIGFMAVQVPAGEAEIRFDYKTPGLDTGMIVSLIAVIITAVYLLLSKKLSSKKIDIED